MRVLVLLFLMLGTFNSLYAAQNKAAYASVYTTNPDGTASYIGNCVLHMDYLDKGIEKGRELAPTISYPNEAEAQAWIDSLSDEGRNLVRATAEAYGAELAGASLLKIVQGFDDLTIFDLNLTYYRPPTAIIKVVSYGVGGGNGGYYFFEETKSGYKLVGNTFDNDLVKCDERYEFKK